MSKVKAIYARASNAVMGRQNTLPWNVPSDLRRFKRLTSGCIVVMGYKTWLSIGCRPLPHRLNVVIADPKRQVRQGVQHDDAIFTVSLEAAVNLYRGDARTIWVIGGPGLIAEAMEKFDAEVVRTTLELDVEGDVFSDIPDTMVNTDYIRVGFEEFRCFQTNCGVRIERFVKSGIDSGLK